MSARGLVMGALVLLSITHTLANAQEAVPQEAVPQEALRLYQQGLQQYDQAEFDQAIESFRGAYALTRDPALLFNIAQAYRRKGKGSCAAALAHYQRYLESRPEAAKRDNVLAVVEEIRPCAEEEERASAAAQAPDRTVTRPATRKTSRASTRLPLVGGATGLALSAAGAGLWLWSHADFNRMKESGCAPYCAPDELDGIQARERAGVGLAGAGLAISAAAAVWWFMTGSSRSAPPTVGVILSGGNRVLLRGTF